MGIYTSFGSQAGGKSGKLFLNVGAALLLLITFNQLLLVNGELNCRTSESEFYIIKISVNFLISPSPKNPETKDDNNAHFNFLEFCLFFKVSSVIAMFVRNPTLHVRRMAIALHPHRWIRNLVSPQILSGMIYEFIFHWLIH